MVEHVKRDDAPYIPSPSNQNLSAISIVPEQLQTKLEISDPADPLEQEADRLADEVMRPSEKRVARSISGVDQARAGGAQGAPPAEGANAQSLVTAALNSSGAPLGNATAGFMERRFGHDFSQVRVHADDAASRSAHAVQARAYTVGRDIVFGAGNYSPGTPDGDRLLAHELTHVVQQTGGGALSGDVTEAEPSSLQMKPVSGAARVLQRDPLNKPGAPAPPAPPAPPADPQATSLPTLGDWTQTLTEGSEGPGISRDMAATPQKVFKGDRANITVAFKSITDEQRKDLVLEGSAEGGARVANATWAGNKATWNVTFEKAGVVRGKFAAKSTLMPGAAAILGEHQADFQVVSDLQDFILGVQSAQGQIIGKFSGAGAKLGLAVIAFRAAQADQDAALKDVGAQEKMVDDLLWGALFAGAGGFAGGAVGGLMKQWQGDVAAKTVAGEGFTDLAKDTVKFSVRSLDRLRGAGGTKTSGDSTSPTSPTATPGGERSAAGENPLDFLASVQSRILGDQALVQKKLVDLIEAARQARDANSKADFDADPMTVATASSQVDTIVAELSTDKKFYLRSLWKTWLGTYGYKVMTIGLEGVTPGTQQGAVSNVDDKLRDAILKAAKQCDEDGDEWIRTFSLPSKQKAEDAASKANHPAPAQP
jgi:hypothetical protein